MTRRKRLTDRGPSKRLFLRTAGVLTIVALMVFGLATTVFAWGGSGYDYGDRDWYRWTYWGGHHYTTTTKHTTTTTTHPTTTTTKATTTTTMATTTTTKPHGDDGCTPGYWRQPHHFDSWAGLSPGDDYGAVFGVTPSFSATLGEAVRARGGGESALARHAVAALLNASSPDVAYAFSTADVISMVQDAYATGDFEGFKDILGDANEEGCPLS